LIELMPSSTPRWLWKLDATHRLFIALAGAIAAFLLLPSAFGFSTHILVAWDAGVGWLLLLTWSIIVTAHPRQIQHRAQTDDISRLIVGVLLISATSVSLFAIMFLMRETKNIPPAQEDLHIILSILAVLGSWLVLHTVFCLHYAHQFYSPNKPNKSNKSNKTDEQQESPGGLDFPGNQQPDYLDFAYFSFVIGMTAQVSDVEISSRTIRRIALFHGMLSFAFNTVVVALSVNIISQLLQ
jgi:uncharacterized membrane protein